MSDNTPKRGRPPKVRSGTVIPLQPRKIIAPFAASAGTPNPRWQRGFKFFMEWLACAETSTRAEDKIASFETGLAVLAEHGLTLEDVLKHIPEPTK